VKLSNTITSLDQIRSGTLSFGIVPAARVQLYDAASVRSLVEEDFFGGLLTSGNIGSLGWATAASGSGAPVAANGEVGHPGQIILSTGATINSFETLYLAPSTGVPFHPGNLFDLTFIFKASIFDANIGYNIGLQDQLNTQDPTNGIYLQKKPADGDFFYVCRAGGAETRIDSFFGADANWHSFRIVQSVAGTIRFFRDGAEGNTISSNVPATVLNPLAVITNAVAADKRITLDYYSHQITVLR
jgi:hypothetical protein